MANPQERNEMCVAKLFSSHLVWKKEKEVESWLRRRDEKLKRHWNRINSMKLFNKMLTNTRIQSFLVSISIRSDDLTILRNSLGSLSASSLPFLPHTRERTFIVIIIVVVDITYQNESGIRMCVMEGIICDWKIISKPLIYDSTAPHYWIRMSCIVRGLMKWMLMS
jgi:hypothetical protein